MIRVGDRALQTRFAIPDGRAADVLRRLDDTALGLGRARLAAALGLPDPFHVREALAAAPDAPVTGGPGEPLGRDDADAALVAAGPHPGLVGLFAGRPPGPRTRAVPFDDARHAALRFPRRPLPSLQLGEPRRWSTAEIGDDRAATVRCIQALPGGVVALGSDYGLTLARGDRFEPFPWPPGARREARRVEAMAWHRGALHVGTQQALLIWPLRGEASVRRHARDGEEGWDDLRAMHSDGERLRVGWRTHLDGGNGPAEVISFAEVPGGVVYAGTIDGELHVVDGGGPVRTFADHKGRPIRHLAFADGRLWVAAAGALHDFDGASWRSTPGEPTALCADPDGRLWALRDGALHVAVDGALRRVPVDLDRPWTIGATPEALWIGGRDAVWRIPVRSG